MSGTIVTVVGIEAFCTDLGNKGLYCDRCDRLYHPVVYHDKTGDQTLSNAVKAGWRIGKEHLCPECVEKVA